MTELANGRHLAELDFCESVSIEREVWIREIRIDLQFYLFTVRVLKYLGKLYLFK